MTSFAFHGQPVANGLAFSVASMILHPCRFLKQRLPKHTKVTSAGNVCGRVMAKRGGKSKPASSLRRASSIWCIVPRSANHSLHGPMSGEAEFQEREGNPPWITHRIDVRSHAGAISWLTIISTALLWTPEASYFGAYRIANRGCENLIGPLIYKVFA